jgi:hypothetical protein
VPGLGGGTAQNPGPAVVGQEPDLGGLLFRPAHGHPHPAGAVHRTTAGDGVVERERLAHSPAGRAVEVDAPVGIVRVPAVEATAPDLGAVQIDEDDLIGFVIEQGERRPAPLVAQVDGSRAVGLSRRRRGGGDGGGGFRRREIWTPVADRRHHGGETGENGDKSGAGDQALPVTHGHQLRVEEIACWSWR